MGREFAVRSIIGLHFRKVAVPAVAVLVPHHADRIEPRDLVLGQALPAHTEVGKPCPEREAVLRPIGGRHVEIAVRLKVLLRRSEIALETELGHAVPNHADRIEPADALLVEPPEGVARPDAPLHGHPIPEAVSLRRLIALGDFEIAVFPEVGRGMGIHRLPRYGERLFERVEECAALARLVDEGEALGDDAAMLARQAVVPHRFRHLVFERAHGVEVFKVVYKVEDDGLFLLRRRQRAPDLLLVDDGRDGRTEEDDAVHIGHMDALVEHIDAI